MGITARTAARGVHDVGVADGWRSATALAIDLTRTPRRCIMTLRGELTQRTVGLLGTALTRLLGEGDPVLVDLAALRVRWVPALRVFPTTSAAAGGWPLVRLVLFNAAPEVAAALHRTGVPRTVPLEPTFKTAVQRLSTRPVLVVRHHDLPRDVGSPHHARALVHGACNDWGMTAIAAEAALVATELVANAIWHADTGCRLRIGLDERGLHLSVRDHRADRLYGRRPPDTVDPPA
jgi:hypothetical protein